MLNLEWQLDITWTSFAMFWFGIKLQEKLNLKTLTLTLHLNFGILDLETQTPNLTIGSPKWLFTCKSHMGNDSGHRVQTKLFKFVQCEIGQSFEQLQSGSKAQNVTNKLWTHIFKSTF
jgi:hypothetical protein